MRVCYELLAASTCGKALSSNTNVLKILPLLLIELGRPYVISYSAYVETEVLSGTERCTFDQTEKTPWWHLARTFRSYPLSACRGLPWSWSLPAFQ